MAREKLTSIEVMTFTAKTILAAGIRGVSPGTFPGLEDAAAGKRTGFRGLHVEWTRTWAVGASISISTRPGVGPTVEVNWSSTHRTPAAASAAIALYREVTDLACEIEAELMRYELVEDDDA